MTCWPTGLVKGIAWGRNALTCPVRRWAAWQEVWQPLNPEAPAFLSVRGHTHIPGQGISGQTVARAVKRLAKAGGENPDDFAGHSLRAGFITAAVQAGASADRIMAQTGHKSYEVMSRYIRRASVWEENPSGLIGL